MHAWEESKENIRPLSTGRNIETLNQLLNQQNENEIKEKITEQINKYENDIKKYSGDDPLDLWLRYIRWAEQISINNVYKDLKLNELYKKCLNSCKSNKYSNDERYVHLFIDYAKKYDRYPLNILEWMYKHGYGNQSSDFYIAWSESLEEVQLIEKAEKVLDMGLTEKAQPYQKLKIYYENFLKRSDNYTDLSKVDNGRNALYQLETASKTAPIERSQSHLPGVMQIASSDASQKNRKPDIYTGDKLSSTLESGKTDYKDNVKMPFEIEINKENSMNPDKWNTYSIHTKTNRIPDATKKDALDVPIFADLDVKQFPNPRFKTNANDTDNDPNLKKKLAVAFRLLKPNDDDDIEFQFEELRAVQYFAMYEKRSKKEHEMENEINQLKQKLAHVEGKLKVNTASCMTEAETNTTVSLKEFTKSKISGKNSNYTEHKQTNDFTCGVNDNNFTNVSFMSTFTKPYDDRKFNDTQDHSTTNWITNMTKPSNTSVMGTTSIFPTPTNRNVTMHTKMARQDVNALFGSTSTDTSTNTTMACNDGKSIAIHNDFEASNFHTDAKSIVIHNDFENTKHYTNLKETSDAHFSVFHDPTANITNKYATSKQQSESKILTNNDDDENIVVYQSQEEKVPRKASILKQPLQSRKPLKSIEETEAKIPKISEEPNNEEIAVDDSTSEATSKFPSLNDQYTAKLCFKPSAMSTISIKPYLDQMKKAKFNETVDIDEISDNYDETIKFEKNPDQLSQIIEEDFKTEYGWSHLMDKQQKQKLEQTKTDTLKKPTETESEPNLSITGSWDYYKMDITAEKPQQVIEAPSDFTEMINRPLDFNTQKINFQQVNLLQTINDIGEDTTITSDIDKEKYHFKQQNYKICTSFSSLNTTSNASVSKCVSEKSQFVEYQPSQLTEKIHLTLNQSKFVQQNITNITLPELALPPDMTCLKDKSVLSQQHETLSKSIFQQNDISHKIAEKEIEEPERDIVEEPNELLTKEGLDETMTINFRKCYSVIAAATGGILNLTTNQCAENASVLEGFDQNNSMLNTVPLPNISRYQNYGASNTNDTFSTINFKTTNLMTIDENSRESNRSQSPNETILNAIREPFDYKYKNRLLARKQEFLEENKNYLDFDNKMPVIQQNRMVMFNNECYKIIKEVGSGAYAKIYIMDKKNQTERAALKVSTQPTAWEFYVTETLHERIKPIQKNIIVESSFIKIRQFLKYENGILCSMNYYKNGTLLELINYHIKNNVNFPYWFVIYLTLEFLSIINYLHQAKIIHGDIKPDNLMINELPKNINYFDASRTKCLVLIDFNRSIDLEMFPEETEFDAKLSNKSLLCCEMLSDKPWTYQIDYFGVLSSVHCLVFKKYMSTYLESERFRINTSFPRSYDRLFSKFFDTYLNIPSCKTIPNLETEWIPQFVSLFRTEIVNFPKSEKYLSDLTNTYNQRT